MASQIPRKKIDCPSRSCAPRNGRKGVQGPDISRDILFLLPFLALNISKMASTSKETAWSGPSKAVHAACELLATLEELPASWDGKLLGGLSITRYITGPFRSLATSVEELGKMRTPLSPKIDGQVVTILTLHLDFIPSEPHATTYFAERLKFWPKLCPRR